ncbi:MAG: thioesterase family protein [Solirubrobacteraceae bacterium]
MNDAQAIFTVEGDRVIASELARGPWDPNAQHGGAPAALIMRAFEQLEPDASLQLARVTYELMRPVPLGELRLSALLVRPGKRVQLLEASLFTPDGTEVVKARALRIRRASVETVAGEDPVPLGPDTVPPGEQGPGEPGVTMFAPSALELRFIEGAFREPGPATAWFRMHVQLVAGESPTPLQRLAAAADFPNGIGSSLPWTEYVFINPDLTIYIEREPVGEWICLQAQMRVRNGGVGFAEAVLFDEQGRVGRSLQALLIMPRS